MPKIVSNTTPIISLLKLNRLDILKKLYNNIYIPLAVYNEIEAGKIKEYYQDLSKLNWIKIEEIKDPKAVNYFLDLDAGEAEAIVLATELKANLIIIDEKLGRFYANHLGLKITGTLGVLVKAKSYGYVDKLKPLFEELANKDVWIGEKLKMEILKRVGE